MKIDKLGKKFKERQKRNEKVEVERRKEDNKITLGTKTVKKTKK